MADALQRRLADLERVTLPSLRTAATADELERLSETTREDFGLIERSLEDLSLLAEECTREQDRQAALAEVGAFRRQLDSQRQAYRQAALATKRRLDSQRSASHRADLLGGASSKAKATVAATPSSGDDALMSATSDVTDGLRRTMQLMQQELDRSLLTNQMLESSTDTMRRTTTQQSAFSDVLSASKSLITALERADLLDRLLILAALAFFGLVCAFIIKRRVLDRGIRLASVLVPKRKRAVAASAVSAATAIVASVSPLSSVLTTVAVASSLVQLSSASVEPVVVSTPTASTIEPTPPSETLDSISASTTVPIVEAPTTAPVAMPPEDAEDDLPEPTDAAFDGEEDEDDEDDGDGEEWEDVEDEDGEDGEDELLDVDLGADVAPDATEPDAPEPAPASPPVLTAEPVVETAAPDPVPVHNEL